MAKYSTKMAHDPSSQAQRSFQLHSLQEGSSLQSNNNFSMHSKSQKPVEFKKIQNLSVKAGGQVAVTNIQNNNAIASQKHLIKINYDDLKKALQSDGRPSQA